jgi:uncharacterized membrane protein
MSQIAIHRGGTPPLSIATSLAAGVRLREIDMWRGLVIVLMALDHVRDYFHAGAFLFNPLDPERANAALYATRWITHLCAPSFVFLAGLSAFLQLAKGKQVPHLSRFLLTRGLWLIALDLTIISFGWAFALPFPLFMQVIWAIGWSMLALAGLVWLPRMAVLAIGLAIIAGHNLFDQVTPDHFGWLSPFWTFLHEGGALVIAGKPVGIVSYPVLPWIGVMAFGYGLGAVFLTAEPQRDGRLLALGGVMFTLFLLLRGWNLYGDPDPWRARDDLIRSIMAFLDVHKYPPSLMYVMATLGIGFMLIPLLARLRGPVSSVLLGFGGAPFFFYVLHIYVVHGLAIAANAAVGRDVSAMFNFFANMVASPERYQHLGFPLALVYVAWIIVLALLYPICRWWISVKQQRKGWWLSYL